MIYEQITLDIIPGAVIKEIECVESASDKRKKFVSNYYKRLMDKGKFGTFEIESILNKVYTESTNISKLTIEQIAVLLKRYYDSQNKISL